MPLKAVPTPIRFWRFVEPMLDDRGCWEWTGARSKRGYGVFGISNPRKNLCAHRYSWELANERTVPEGLQLDHLCRNPRCVNPDHLEPVTHAENVRRGIAGQVNRERQLNLTHCKRGHEFSSDNTGRDHRGHRYCITCSRMLHLNYYYKNHERRKYEQRIKARERKQRSLCPG